MATVGNLLGHAEQVVAECRRMATDYEKVYQQSPHALGLPTDEFVGFFKSFDKKGAWVLDVGCGQGRDALFIARLGHRVVAVDLAPTGIRQLLEEAAAEGLEVEAVVSDIREHQPSRLFDVIVIDRTLHMLGADDRHDVLSSILSCSAPAGSVLIADERSNMQGLQAVFDQSGECWNPILKKAGYLFMRHTPCPAGKSAGRPNSR
jgi:tellurite methyltransferase